MSDLIAWNKRLILFSDHNNTAHVAYDRNFTKQNQWSLGDLGKDWDCPSRWNNGQYQDAPYPKLFLFNHYRNAPTVGTAALDNTYEKIMDRIASEFGVSVQRIRYSADPSDIRWSTHRPSSSWFRASPIPSW